jgi:hypothetical protein
VNFNRVVPSTEKIAGSYIVKLRLSTTQRGTIDEAVAAGLVAQRAQGIEPSAYAKGLALRVASGEMSLAEMEELLLKYHGQNQTKTK